MSVSGLCQVCESAEATDRCDRCGALACGRHYDDDRDMCSACVAEVTGGDRDDRDEPQGGRQFDDHDVPGEYEF